MPSLRMPKDRLFTICVVGATLVYVGFLIAMRFAPSQPDGSDRQAQLGVVDGRSGEYGPGDPNAAQAVAEGSGSRPGYVFIGGSGVPPVSSSQPARAVEGPGAAIDWEKVADADRSPRSGGPDGSRGPKLALDQLLFEGVRAVASQVDRATAQPSAGRR